MKKFVKLCDHSYKVFLSEVSVCKRESGGHDRVSDSESQSPGFSPHYGSPCWVLRARHYNIVLGPVVQN